jgi:hypothetical protein
MSTEELKAICDLTNSLTRMRWEECRHLCIENFAPELFGKLLWAYNNNTRAPQGESRD